MSGGGDVPAGLVLDGLTVGHCGDGAARRARGTAAVPPLRGTAAVPPLRGAAAVSAFRGAAAVSRSRGAAAASGSRGAAAVLSGVDAVAGRGELTVLLGPNGAGKSTLLRTLAGLQPAFGGAATLDGEDLLALRPAHRARRVGVVLTDRPDPGLLTGRDVVELGRLPHTGSTGVLGEADHTAVDTAIDAVRATALAGRSLGRLSDGERQRLMVARALAQQPSLLLLDEPSAFLDVAARVALLGLLRRLAREHGLTVLLSTHDLELALRLADRAWLLDGSGAVRTGTPDALAAAGAIGAAFDTDELAFDPVAGTFRLR